MTIIEAPAPPASDVGAAIEALRQDFNHVKDHFDMTIRRIEQAIDHASQKADDAMKRTEEETLQRKNQYTELQSQMTRNQREHDEKLGKIDDKLDHVSKALERIAGSVEGWSKAVESRDELYKANGERIDKIETQSAELATDVQLVTSAQANLSNEIGKLKTTIHGDTTTPHAPASIFRELESIKETIADGFKEQTRLTTTALTVGAENQRRIMALEDARARDDAKVARYKDAVLGTTKAIFASRQAWVVIATVLFGLMLSISPDMKDIVYQVLTWLLKGGT